MPGEPAPLRNLPIEVVIDGVPVSGVITFLYPNGMVVEITAPVVDLRTSLHVPHFAMYPVNRLAISQGDRTTSLTERGRERAEGLLRLLYEYARGKDTGWGVEEKRDGRWTEATVDGRDRVK